MKHSTQIEPIFYQIRHAKYYFKVIALLKMQIDMDKKSLTIMHGCKKNEPPYLAHREYNYSLGAPWQRSADGKSVMQTGRSVHHDSNASVFLTPAHARIYTTPLICRLPITGPQV